MLIVGPEAPLVEGIKDYFDAKKEFSDLKIIGPSKTRSFTGRKQGAC